MLTTYHTHQSLANQIKFGIEPHITNYPLANQIEFGVEDVDQTLHMNYS